MTDFNAETALRELLYTHPDHAEFQAGSTEPWIANVLAALVVANDTHTAIEIGGFMGFTSRRLIRALAQLPHDTWLTVCEIDEERAVQTARALETLSLVSRHSTRFRIVCDDSLHWLPTLTAASVDFAWIDGNHEKPHVTQELTLLWPKMRANGLICLHDVYGVCDLQTVVHDFGGYALDLPRLGPAGGLGIIQICI